MQQRFALPVDVSSVLGAVPTEGYCSSQALTKSDSNAACSFVGDVWTDLTQRSDVTAETCCSMDSSASKVTPRVFTTLENGMDASPTERQSTGTVSLLDDGPQRNTSVLLLFCFLI